MTNNLGMPQAAQGSGYPLQSFLKKNQKRIYTAIPHAKIPRSPLSGLIVRSY